MEKRQDGKPRVHINLPLQGNSGERTGRGQGLAESRLDWCVCVCSTAVATNDHKLGALKQQKCILSLSGGYESKVPPSGGSTESFLASQLWWQLVLLVAALPPSRSPSPQAFLSLLAVSSPSQSLVRTLVTGFRVH